MLRRLVFFTASIIVSIDACKTEVSLCFCYLMFNFEVMFLFSHIPETSVLLSQSFLTLVPPRYITSRTFHKLGTWRLVSHILV